MPASRQRPVLIGIGLVLVGLLAGILFMLVVVGVRVGGSPEPAPVVTPVELGRAGEAVRPLWAPDSGTAPVVVDPLALNAAFREVAERVTASVVYIQVEGRGNEFLPRDLFHNWNDEDRERYFRERGPRQSVGSGVILSEDGYVVTNHHVVQSAGEIQVLLADKRQYSAEVVGLDPSTDLAVIRLLGAEALPVAPIGDSDEVRVGEWVLAVGNPFRLTSTVTAGIVSALGRQVNIIEDDFGIEDFIQTDAAINPGNSGGALVNLQGQLVGIATAIATESGSYEGYGFAVPVNLVRRVAEDLISYGEVRRGILGVIIEPVDDRQAQRLGLDRVGGVYLSTVHRDGAAYRAGLRENDVVLSIDGQPVNAPNELQRRVAQHRPGEQLAVEVWRQDERLAFDVTLLSRDDEAYTSWFEGLTRDNAPPELPELAPEEPERAPEELVDWGLGLRDLTERERVAFGVEQGAFVAYVERGSRAARAGLPRGVVVQRIEDREVTDSEDAREAYEATGNDALLVRVRRPDGATAFYEIPPARAE